MGDWRIPLATDLARRSYEAGACRGDRKVLQRCLNTLADQEKEFLKRYPDRAHEAVGYSRAVEQYGKNGLGMLVSMAFKYWPEIPATSGENDIGVRVACKKNRTTPSPPEPPSEVSPSPVSLLKPVEVVFQILLSQKYDEKETAIALQEFLGESAVISETFLKGVRLDLLVTASPTSVQAQEMISEIPWVTDVLTKPKSLFRIAI